MKKRNLIFLSLLLISILIISGCQYSAVGRDSGTGKKSIYSATDSTYTTTNFGKNYGVNLQIKDTCESIKNTFWKGTLIRGPKDTCYEVIGCLSLQLNNIDVNTNGETKSHDTLMIKQLPFVRPCIEGRGVSEDLSGDVIQRLYYDYGISVAYF